MNRAQKIAWWMVITILLALAVSLTVFCVLYAKMGFTRALRLGFACMGIAGFGGLAPLIFRKDKGKVTFDERDRIIKRRAALACFAISYGIYGVLSMTIWKVVGAGNSINVDVLPAVWCAAAISAFFTHSVAILIQYGWGGKDGEK